MMATSDHGIGDEDLDRIFRALADPTRRAILLRVQESPASVAELTEPFAMSQPAISKHLRVLEEAGLIRRVRDGRRVFSALELDPLIRASVFISRFERRVEDRLDRLEQLLDEPAPDDGGAEPGAAGRRPDA